VAIYDEIQGCDITREDKDKYGLRIIKELKEQNARIIK